jgi:Protein of unknown function (DUF3489)
MRLTMRAARLLDLGLVKEVRARKDMPVWRRDEEAGQAFVLKLTAAGLKAIAAEANEDAGDDAATRNHGGTGGERQAPDAEQPEPLPRAGAGALLAHPVAPRPGTKISAVIGALESTSGATIDEIVAVTRWLPHTARAALTGLRKRGYAIASDRSDRTRGSVYRIAALASEAVESEAAVAAAQAAQEHDEISASKPARTVRKAGGRTRRAG